MFTSFEKSELTQLTWALSGPKGSLVIADSASIVSAASWAMGHLDITSCNYEKVLSLRVLEDHVWKKW